MGSRRFEDGGEGARLRSRSPRGTRGPSDAGSKVGKKDDAGLAGKLWRGATPAALAGKVMQPPRQPTPRFVPPKFPDKAPLRPPSAGADAPGPSVVRPSAVAAAGSGGPSILAGPHRLIPRPELKTTLDAAANSLRQRSLDSAAEALETSQAVEHRGGWKVAYLFITHMHSWLYAAYTHTHETR